MIPKKLLQIADDIRSAGGKAVLVGGVVRDSLLGAAESARDFDIEVYRLSQDALLSILSRHGKPNMIGKAFGVAHLSRNGAQYDFSFPRTESKIGAGHKAFSVQTDPNMTFEEAAKRRDFTINAMGMELPGLELYDPYGGRKDLENRILRHVSSAFAEDSLRVLRGAQFAARFELRAAKETIELCRTLSLDDLSRERIEEEFRKWLMKGAKPSYGLDFFIDAGLEKTFPEIDAKRSKQLGAALDCLAAHRSSLSQHDAEALMFAGLLSEADSRPLDFLRRWIPVNALIKRVPTLLSSLALLDFSDKSSLRRCALKAGGLKLPAILKSAVSGEDSIRKTAQAIGEEMVIWDAAPEPFLTGQILIGLGYVPGPEIGSAIARAFEMQLSGKISSMEEALEFVKAK